MIYLIAIYLLIGLLIAISIDMYDSKIYLWDIALLIYMIIISPTAMIYFIIIALIEKIKEIVGV
jgi:hypothetical protein